MDATLTRLTDFCSGLEYGHLTPTAVHECKRRLLDTVACALGGYRAEPARIARTLAGRVRGDPPARVLASHQLSSPELAAFANGVMIRYLDLNDATGSGGGHPSDAFGAMLAAAETTRTDGRTFITAAAIVYELYLGFFQAVRVRNSGWDHLIYTVLGGAAAVAKMMRLPRDKMANALSLALTANFTLEVVRRGHLTMWKGAAAGNACRNAIFAAQLAAEGMTAPVAVFEGEHGVHTVVGKFDWPELPQPGGHYRVQDSQIKIYPCEYHGQSPIEAALSIRPQIDPDRIESIVVSTYWFAWSEIGSEPEKWAPTTRETADHSIPFLVCAALLDGRVEPSSYTDERIRDPRLRALMQKVQVIYDKSLDAYQPQSNPCRIEITMTGGEKRYVSVDHPKGHVRNPAADSDLERKLVVMNDGLVPQDRIDRIIETCWRLDALDDMRELVSLVRCA